MLGGHGEGAWGSVLEVERGEQRHLREGLAVAVSHVDMGAQSVGLGEHCQFDTAVDRVIVHCAGLLGEHFNP